VADHIENSTMKVEVSRISVDTAEVTQSNV